MTLEAVGVRAVEAADEADIVALWRETFPGDYADDDLERDFRQKLRFQGELFLVAVCGGRAVGTVLGGYDGHRGHVHAVAVAPAVRRNGVGRRLFEELCARLRACGCRKLNLQVRPDNAAALAFYARLGFHSDGDVCLSLGLGS